MKRKEKASHMCCTWQYSRRWRFCQLFGPGRRHIPRSSDRNQQICLEVLIGFVQVLQHVYRLDDAVVENLHQAQSVCSDHVGKIFIDADFENQPFASNHAHRVCEIIAQVLQRELVFGYIILTSMNCESSKHCWFCTPQLWVNPISPIASNRRLNLSFCRINTMSLSSSWWLTVSLCDTYHEKRRLV